MHMGMSLANLNAADICENYFFLELLLFSEAGIAQLVGCWVRCRA